MKKIAGLKGSTDEEQVIRKYNGPTYDFGEHSETEWKHPYMWSKTTKGLVIMLYGGWL